jgi:hypothetical protein
MFALAGLLSSADGSPLPADRVAFILSMASRLKLRDERLGRPILPLYRYTVSVLRTGQADASAELSGFYNGSRSICAMPPVSRKPLELNCPPQEWWVHVQSWVVSIHLSSHWRSVSRKP